MVSCDDIDLIVLVLINWLEHKPNMHQEINEKKKGIQEFVVRLYAYVMGRGDKKSWLQSKKMNNTTSFGAQNSFGYSTPTNARARVLELHYNQELLFSGLWL